MRLCPINDGGGGGSLLLVNHGGSWLSTRNDKEVCWKSPIHPKFETIFEKKPGTKSAPRVELNQEKKPGVKNIIERCIYKQVKNN